MRKLFIMTLTALASVPVIGLAAIGAAAPAFADSPAQGPACVSQSLNPHPTDPAGGATASLFCTTPNPNPTTNGSGSGARGSTCAGAVSTAAKTGGASTAGGQTSLASSTGSGTASSAPDESIRFNWASDSNGARCAAG